MPQQKTYRLYIGANNTTGEVETEKLEATLNNYFDGYTVEQSVGYWLGQRENSVVVTLQATAAMIALLISELKEILEQQAIAYQPVAALQFA